MIVKMIQNLGNRMEKIEEMFNKDLDKEGQMKSKVNRRKEIIKIKVD